MSFNLSSIINDAEYLRFVRRHLKQKVRGLRRRGLIATLYRAMQETDPQGTFTGVEVGVKFGTLSQQILEMLPQVRQMILVDPWKEFPVDHPDRKVHGYANRSQQGWDQMARACAERMKSFGDRAEIMRMTSMEANAEFFHDTLDWLMSKPFFVYIDASHDYIDVLEDCREWWKIVQPGGLLCGDDYRELGHKDRNEGVSSAVEEFSQEVGLPVIGHHRNFFIHKQ